MRRRLRVRGEQQEEFDLERLAHALLSAAREAEKKRQPEDRPESRERQYG
jgi:hypothetical protein